MAPTLTVSIGSLLWPAAAAIVGSALLSSKIWWSNWCGSCACFGVLLGQPKMLLYLDIFSGEIVIWWRTTVLSYIIVLPLRRFLNLDRLVMIWFKSVLQKSIPISGRFGCQRQNCQQEEVVFAAEACLPYMPCRPARDWQRSDGSHLPMSARQTLLFIFCTFATIALKGYKL